MQAEEERREQGAREVTKEGEAAPNWASCLRTSVAGAGRACSPPRHRARAVPWSMRAARSKIGPFISKAPCLSVPVPEERSHLQGYRVIRSRFGSSKCGACGGAINQGIKVGAGRPGAPVRSLSTHLHRSRPEADLADLCSRPLVAGMLPPAARGSCALCCRRTAGRRLRLIPPRRRPGSRLRASSLAPVQICKKESDARKGGWVHATCILQQKRGAVGDQTGEDGGGRGEEGGGNDREGEEAGASKVAERQPQGRSKDAAAIGQRRSKRRAHGSGQERLAGGGSSQKAADPGATSGGKQGAARRSSKRRRHDQAEE